MLLPMALALQSNINKDREKNDSNNTASQFLYIYFQPLKQQE